MQDRRSRARIVPTRRGRLRSSSPCQSAAERSSRLGGVRSFLEQDTDDYEPTVLGGQSAAAATKVLFRLAASFEHEGRSISICAESLQDIRNAWEELDLSPLDEARVQRVFLGGAARS